MLYQAKVYVVVLNHS